MLIKKNNFSNVVNIHNYSIAIGNFDGVHEGHRYLLRQLINCKKNNEDKLAVLSFFPHPVKVLAKNRWKKNLVKIRTKYNLLKHLGIDALFLITFNKKFSLITAEDFIEKYLIDKLKVKNIVVGEDFKFGSNRKGNINLLKKYEEKKYFKLISIKKKGSEKEIYSSSLIRSYIEQGKIYEASKVLGYYWEVYGKVIRGKARGRLLGYPTANLRYTYQMPPSKGIYASWTKIEGEKIWHMSAVSTGTRPQYNGVEEILEVYIFNFSGNLYQKRIRVAFIEKIRDEEIFKNEEELKVQMKNDCIKIQRILEEKVISNNNVGK